MMCTKGKTKTTKNKLLAAAVDLRHAYNRLQFKPLNKVLQYDVTLTLTRLFAAGSQETKVGMRPGSWSSTFNNKQWGFHEALLFSKFSETLYVKEMADLTS